MKRIALLLVIAFATTSPIASFARGANNPETVQAPTKKQKEKAKAQVKSIRKQRAVRRADPKHYVNNKPRPSKNNFSQPKAKTTKPAPVMSAGKTQ